MNDPIWKSRLYLTMQVRKGVETGGIVLLFRRSRSWKTHVMDDCDRMTTGAHAAYQDARHNALNVDKVQDSQAKILCRCRPRDLLSSGDPAQAVVQSDWPQRLNSGKKSFIDFRHFLSAMEEDKKELKGDIRKRKHKLKNNL